MNKNEVIVFYDGWCPLCKSEIDHYRRFKNKNLIFMDIRENNIHEEYNLNPKEIRKTIHSLYRGKSYTGIDTFLLIWKELDEFSLFYKVFSFKPLRPFYDFGYNIFAKYIRPRLSNKKDKYD